MQQKEETVVCLFVITRSFWKVKQIKTPLKQINLPMILFLNYVPVNKDVIWLPPVIGTTVGQDIFTDMIFSRIAENSNSWT